jgi:3-deoxy-D-glycero-D-galacto-nononate 9-phosphatase
MATFEFPKLVITDIDGVWTDGGMYYDAQDNELKKFNTSDSAGVRFLEIVGTPFAIFTGEDTDIVRRRAKKLNVKHLYCGVRDKLGTAKILCEQLNIDLLSVAFVGDDLNDLALLKAVGISACPSSAPDYIQTQVDLQLKRRGGDGAFREFVEWMLKKADLLDKTIEAFVESLAKPA